MPTVLEPNNLSILCIQPTEAIFLYSCLIICVINYPLVKCPLEAFETCLGKIGRKLLCKRKSTKLPVSWVFCEGPFFAVVSFPIPNKFLFSQKLLTMINKYDSPRSFNDACTCFSDDTTFFTHSFGRAKV